MRHLGATEIIDATRRRQQRFGERDLKYDLYTSYYDSTQSGQGWPTLAANSAGRPLLRQVGETFNSSRGEGGYSSRRLPPIVDDAQALMGQWPSITVDIPEGTEQAEEKAEVQTKYLNSTYELSDMGVQHPLSAFHASLLGDSCITIVPVPDKLRTAWQVVSPRICYPSFCGGWRSYQMQDLIICEQLCEEDIEQQFQVIPHSDHRDDCVVMTYISESQRTIVVGIRQPMTVCDISWDLGMCPAAWVFNKANGRYAQSDIMNSLGQQDYADFLQKLFADGIVYRTYPLLGIKNPAGVSELTFGPNAPAVALQGDGDIVVREVQGDVNSILQALGNTVNDIQTNAGTSQVRQEGSMKSSIVTGRAVQAVQGPQSERIGLKQQLLSTALRQANEATFRMQERAPVLRDATISLEGRWKGRTFRQDFSSQQDIQGWYRTSVTYDQLTGMNLQQRVATAFEMKQAGLADELHSLDVVGEEDPLAMQKRIETMHEREAQMQQRMQQAGMPPEQQPQPGPDVHTLQTQSMGHAGPRGGMPNMIRRPQGLPVPGAPPPTMPQQPQQPKPTQANGTVDRVRMALFQIADKLKGAVYAVGQFAFGQGSPELVITDHRDYTLVVQTLRPLVPGVRVKALDGRKNNPEEVLFGATRVA